VELGGLIPSFWRNDVGSTLATVRTFADGREALRAPPSLAVLRKRRAQILSVATRRGAHNVRVFGSVARGNQDEESDLDLLVDFDDGVGLFAWAGLIRELEELLGCAVDVVEVASLRPRIRDDVMAEAVPL
jgi:uncharacterized protein